MTTAAVACGLMASTASAQAPGLPALPGLPTVPGVPSAPGVPDVTGTGTDCGSGLIGINLGGTNVCAAPSVPPAAGAQACPDGGAAFEVAGQGVVCLTPGQALGTLPGSGGTACPDSLVGVQLPGAGSLVCVAPTTVTPPANGICTDGLIPVEVLGGSLGCVVASVIGGAGANGANGSNGADGSRAGTTGAAGSSSALAAKRVLKPTLTLKRRLRGSTRGVIRSSTKKVVVTVIGRRNKRVVRYTRQVSLRMTGKATASRPYSARVKIRVATKGRIRIRITSRGTGAIKTATFNRTVSAR